jgi:hypothetical protein
MGFVLCQTTLYERIHTLYFFTYKVRINNYVRDCSKENKIIKYPLVEKRCLSETCLSMLSRSVQLAQQTYFKLIRVFTPLTSGLSVKTIV